MMKKIVILAMTLLATATLTAKPKDDMVRFNKDGEIKIIQLTDLHFKSTRPEECAKTFARMDYIVNEEHPDFIAITGDVLFGKPAKAMLQSILDKLDSYKVPFCIVYGNHDAEQDLSRQEMSQMIVSAKYNVNKLDENGELADIRLPVASTVNPGSDPLDLYFLDSHDYSTMKDKVGGYAWFTFDQIAWMRKQCETATEANGGMHVPSFAFFHIPFPEFLEAWESAEAAKHNSVAGIRGEYGGHPRVNSGMYAAMLETGNVIGVFCGHDHDSNFIIPYNGIALVYGQFSGDDTVYNHLVHGTRVISVKEGESAFTTWIHDDDGRIQFKVKFENGELTRGLK